MSCDERKYLQSPLFLHTEKIRYRNENLPPLIWRRSRVIYVERNAQQNFTLHSQLEFLAEQLQEQF
jgi:hypothetical protein